MFRAYRIGPMWDMCEDGLSDEGKIIGIKMKEKICYKIFDGSEVSYSMRRRRKITKDVRIHVIVGHIVEYGVEHVISIVVTLSK